MALVAKNCKVNLRKSHQGDHPAMAAERTVKAAEVEASKMLSRKQEEAILALLTNRTVEDAARACNKRARTLYRWLSEPEFKAAYREARRTTFSQSLARLQQASSAAVSTLLKVMVDAGAPASARVRAAATVLSQTVNAIEIEDLQERLAAVEKESKARSWPDE